MTVAAGPMFSLAIRKRCSWIARRDRKLPFSELPLIIGGTLTGIFLLFMGIIFIQFIRGRRKQRRKRSSRRFPTSENAILSRINRTGHNSVGEDPDVLLAYTAVLENYSAEKHERLKKFLLKFPRKERPVFRYQGRLIRRRKQRKEDSDDLD